MPLYLLGPTLEDLLDVYWARVIASPPSNCSWQIDNGPAIPLRGLQTVRARYLRNGCQKPFRLKLTGLAEIEYSKDETEPYPDSLSPSIVSAEIVLPNFGWVNVKDAPFSAIGNGIADDTIPIQSALATLKDVYFPEGSYLITAGLTLNTGQRIFGENKHGVSIIRGFNGGQMVTMKNKSSICDMGLQGDGANFTGKGILINSTEGNQLARSVRIIDCENYCIDFIAVDSGSRSSWIDCEIWRTNGAVDYAVHIQDAAELSAVPRKFILIETSGLRFLDAGGCNDLFVGESFVGGILWSDNSRGVQIAGTRLGVNEATMTIKGSNHAIAGCNVHPALTLAANVSSSAIGANGYNNLPIVDNSGNRTNVIDEPENTFAPVFNTQNLDGAIGNGTINGVRSQAGGRLKASVEMIAGATTNFGTGGFTFQLPRAGNSTLVQVGSGYIQDVSTGNLYPITPVLAVGLALCTLITANGVAAALTPFAFAAGDIIRFTLDYA